jgi:predicted GIY-YIG superfamily endonuclease
MKCVYLLRSERDPTRRYVGITDDLRRRLAEHNSDKPGHTRGHAPWRLVVAVHFDNAARAEAFERYLKNGSGHAFARRHFW